MSTSGRDDDAGASERRNSSDEAIAVDTVVSEERGRWTVEIVVVFGDGAVQKRVNDYPTRRHAEIAARWIRRAADRDIEGPIHG